MSHQRDIPQDFKPVADHDDIAPSGTQTPSKFQFWIGLGLLVISLGWIGFTSTWNLHRSHFECEHYADIPKYLGGAKGLAKLGVYRDPTTIGLPPMTHYPPANSTFLSLFFLKEAPIDDQLDAASVGMTAIHGIGAILVFLVLTQGGVNPGIAGLGSLLLASSPQWLIHISKFMSDPLFSTLAFVTAWQFLSLPKKPSIPYGIFMGILGSALILTRTAGLPFAFVVGLWSLSLLWKTRKLGWLLPGTILAASLIGWVLFARQGFSYSNDMADRFEGFGGLGSSLPWIASQAFEFLYLGDLLEAYLTAIYNWLSVRTWPAPWILPAVGLGTTSLCIVGIRARKTSSDLWSVLALGIYGIQIAVWPFPLGARCAMPLLPWVAVWSWSGLCALIKSPTIRRLASVGVALVLTSGVAANIRVSISTAKHSLQHSSVRELDEVIQWISTHASPEHNVGSQMNVPRVQISEKLQRPLTLFMNDPATRAGRKLTASELETNSLSTEWLLHSSEAVPLHPVISALYPVVHSSGKWTVHRRRSAATQP